MPNQHRLTLERLAVALGVCAGAACPLPIPHTETVSPVMIGQLLDRDGLPAARVHVATTSSHRDSSCAKAPNARVTDSQGRFGMPLTTERRKVVWVGPERGSSLSYWLCVGRPDSTGTIQYIAANVLSPEESDTLKCWHWEWGSRTRLACNSTALHYVFEGGAWLRSGITGSYRILIAAAERDPRERAYVQWVTSPDSIGRRRVVAIAPLNVEVSPESPRLGGDKQPLTLIGDQWHAILKDARYAGRFAFVLDGPNEVAQVSRR